MSKEIKLRPIVIIHDDGTKETVYVQPETVRSKFFQHLPMALTIVSFVAISLSLYINYLHLKKMKNHGK